MSVRREYIISIKIHQDRNPKNYVEEKLIFSEGALDGILYDNEELGVESLTILKILKKFKEKGGFKI